MLDLRYPQAGYIFDASGHLARIRTQSEQCCQQPYTERLASFEAMRQECERLRTLSAAQFIRHREIESLLDGLLREVDRLATLDLPAPPAGHCTVCHAPLHRRTSLLVPELGVITWCDQCMAGIYALLLQLESPTGVDFI